MKYENTYEIFGDSSPCECESKEEYAEAYLPMFRQHGHEGYWIEKPTMLTGNSNEIRWEKAVWAEAVIAAESRGQEVTDDDYQLPIDRDLLLEYLTEAVEEVESVE